MNVVMTFRFAYYTRRAKTLIITLIVKLIGELFRKVFCLQNCKRVSHAGLMVLCKLISYTKVLPDLKKNLMLYIAGLHSN